MSSVLGVGTDLLRIARIGEALDRHGHRLVDRILSPAERASHNLVGDRGDARVVAKIFAAKEAIAKALGTGFQSGVSWQDIEVSRDALGAPIVVLTNGALNAAKAKGGSRVALSLSDEDEHVLAFAVLLAH